jgi:RHS repeat-associated protein
MVFDKTGALANVKRHDYLPFGEELIAGTGGRTTTQGYVGDSVRQKFTSKERDNETGLDYFVARYYASTQGRFTSPDSVCGCPKNPQTQNLYTYVHNNPLNLVDPTGHSAEIFDKDQDQRDRDKKDQKRKRNEARQRQDDINSLIESGILPVGFGGSDPQNSGPLSPVEIDQLRADVTNLLKDETCARFMSALLSQLSSDTGKNAYSTNAMDIFDAVEQQGSFSRAEGPFSATGGSTVGNGNAAIHINFYISSSPMSSAINGRTILHELLHVGSGANRNYDHYEMARAAYAVAQAQGFNGLGGRPPDGDHIKLDGTSVDTFNRILFQACHVK